MDLDYTKIVFDDGTFYKVPDISYKKYIKSDFYTFGSSDLEYDKYLKTRNMKDITDFNTETIPELTILIEQPYRGRVLKFKCIYDSNADENFDSVLYFDDKN